jgi:hypothetical protein
VERVLAGGAEAIPADPSRAADHAGGTR